MCAVTRSDRAICTTIGGEGGTDGGREGRAMLWARVRVYARARDYLAYGLLEYRPRFSPRPSPAMDLFAMDRSFSRILVPVPTR